MLSLTSDFYMPVKLYKKDELVFTRFCALDGSHIVEMVRGKFHVKHLGATFVFSNGTWELSKYSQKKGLCNEQTNQCLYILNERFMARDWATFLDAQDIIDEIDENVISTGQSKSC